MRLQAERQGWWPLVPLSIVSWVVILSIVGLFVNLPMWLAVTLVHLIELIAGLLLGAIGLVLAGDFTAWWRINNYPNPRMAGAVALLLYLAALAIWRYV